MVSYLWKNSLVAVLEYPDISDNGWNADGTIHWLDRHIPEDIESILLDEEECELDDLSDNDMTMGVKWKVKIVMMMIINNVTIQSNLQSNTHFLYETQV